MSVNQIWATIGKTAECLQTNEVENASEKNAEKLQRGDNPLKWIFIEKKLQILCNAILQIRLQYFYMNWTV